MVSDLPVSSPNANHFVGFGGTALRDTENLDDLDNGNGHRIRVKQELEREKAARGGQLKLEDTYDERSRRRAYPAVAQLQRPKTAHPLVALYVISPL